MGLGSFLNLDLLSVGIAVASIGILSFAVLFNNKRSITNITFFGFSIITIVWGITNYLSYEGAISTGTALWLLRAVIFFGVWHAFSFFQLFYVFPEGRVEFPSWYKFALFPIVVMSAIINLTPLSFSTIKNYSSAGEVSIVTKGPGMLLFIAVVVFCIIGGLVLLIRKLRHARGLERTQFWFIFWGALITISLIFTFNFFLPAVFDWVRLIPLGAVFILPFVAFTSYAIFKHHLLNVKVIATEIVAFLLAVVTLFEIVFAQGLGAIIFQSGVFLLVLSFSILLIKSVLREVEQREELERLNAILSEEKAKVEELSRFKTQLLSLASHQVKAPLSAIKGFVSLILDGTYGAITDATKETLGKVKRSADGLVDLINNMLDLRKVEEGKMEYQFSETDIVKIVTDTVEELRPLAAAKKLELNFTPPQAPILITADGQKLKQVIQNLIDNAIKYTSTPPESSGQADSTHSTGSGQAGSLDVARDKSPQAAFVNVVLREEQSKEMPEKQIVVFSVQDYGFGIKPQLMPYLFEEFVRDEAVKREIRGTGLGLYIARKIVEAHGGRIWAESKGDGQGSIFFVELRKI